MKVGPRLYSVKELQAATGEQLRRKREGGDTRRELETKQEEQRDRESSERVPRGSEGKIRRGEQRTLGEDTEESKKTLGTTRGLEQSFRLGGGEHG